MTIKVLGAEWESGSGAQAPRGPNAHAEGLQTLAQVPQSHAEGWLSSAQATAAHAEGYNTAAQGNYSHSEGYQATAVGTASHAEGYLTGAGNHYAHAEGFTTAANGISAHAEGYNTAASVTAAHSEGNGTTASGNNAHAEGANTTASAVSSHAEGVNSIASGAASHAEGANCKAQAQNSHAEGNYAIADAYGQWARGSVNPSSLNASRAHTGLYISGALTQGTTAVPLTFDGSISYTLTQPNQNVLVTQTKSAMVFEVTVICRRVGVTNAAQGWIYRGMAINDTGTVTVVNNTLVDSWYSSSSLGSTNIIGTSNYIYVQATPNSTIATAWQAVMRTNELVLTA